MLLIPNVAENFCLEATILHDGDVEHPRYTKKRFELGCIAQFVQKGKQNIIICEIRTSSHIQAPNFPGALPYAQQAFLSQQSMLSQQGMSQPFSDNVPPMGHGFGPYNVDL
jgi:hypothetical protein